MAEALRLYLLAFYAVGVTVLVTNVLTTSVPPAQVEKRAEDFRRYLPGILIPLNWLLPPLAILFRFGEIQFEWPALRLLGFLLSLYAASMLLWAPVTLGRFLVPRAVVFHDHVLITAGPYCLVRHPVYSDVLALWLGAALGTGNISLLLFWPIAVIGVAVQARLEEELLRSKFGESYESYARVTGRFLPRVSR